MSQMRKVVINTRFGGFGLSDRALLNYARRKNIPLDTFSEYEIPRDDADLVAVVEKLGKKANGPRARLKVVEIPADVKWQIEEYDGSEHVAEVHRAWY
jgi:hypothetical protein